MILLVLILILMAGGIIAWIAGKGNPLYSRVISLVTVIADFVIALSLFFRNGESGSYRMDDGIFSSLDSKIRDRNPSGSGRIESFNADTYFLYRYSGNSDLVEGDHCQYRFLPLQHTLDTIRNCRSISFHGSVPFLFFLGGDAYPDVFPDSDLGT